MKSGTPVNLTKGQPASWFVKKDDTSIRVTLDRPAKVTVLTPGRGGLMESPQSNVEVKIMRETPNTPPQPVQAFETLEAGSYTITVKPPADIAAMPAYLTLNLPSIQSIEKPLGEFRVTNVPTRFDFTIDKPTKIEAALTRGATDLVLGLEHNGKLINEADDPETMIEQLEAGNYSFIVRQYRDRSTSAPQTLGRR